jgi:hypothetical protein
MVDLSSLNSNITTQAFDYRTYVMKEMIVLKGLGTYHTGRHLICVDVYNEVLPKEKTVGWTSTTFAKNISKTALKNKLDTFVGRKIQKIDQISSHLGQVCHYINV